MWSLFAFFGLLLLAPLGVRGAEEIALKGITISPGGSPPFKFDPEKEEQVYTVILKGPQPAVNVHARFDSKKFSELGYRVKVKSGVDGSITSIPMISDAPPPVSVPLGTDGHGEAEIMIFDKAGELQKKYQLNLDGSAGIPTNTYLQSLKVKDPNGEDLPLSHTLNTGSQIYIVELTPEMNEVTLFPSCFANKKLYVESNDSGDFEELDEGVATRGFTVTQDGVFEKWTTLKCSLTGEGEEADDAAGENAKEYIIHTVIHDPSLPPPKIMVSGTSKECLFDSDNGYMCEEREIAKGTIILEAFAASHAKIKLQSKGYSKPLPPIGTPLKVNIEGQGKDGQGAFVVSLQRGPEDIRTYPINLREAEPLGSVFQPLTPQTPLTIPMIIGYSVFGFLALAVLLVLCTYGLSEMFGGLGGSVAKGAKEGASNLLSLAQLGTFVSDTVYVGQGTTVLSEYVFPLRIVTGFLPASKTFLQGAADFVQPEVVAEVAGRRLQELTMGSGLLTEDSAVGGLIVCFLLFVACVMVHLLALLVHLLINQSSRDRYNDGVSVGYPFTRPHRMKFGVWEIRCLSFLALPSVTASALLVSSPTVTTFWMVMAYITLITQVLVVSGCTAVLTSVLKKKRAVYVVPAEAWAAEMTGASLWRAQHSQANRYRQLPGESEDEMEGKPDMMDLPGIWTDRYCDQLATIPVATPYLFCADTEGFVGTGEDQAGEEGTDCEACYQAWCETPAWNSVVGRIRFTEVAPLEGVVDPDGEDEEYEEDRLEKSGYLMAVPSQVKEVTMVTCRAPIAFWGCAGHASASNVAGVLQTSWLDLLLTPESLARLYKVMGGTAEVTRVVDPKQKGPTYGDQMEDLEVGSQATDELVGPGEDGDDEDVQVATRDAFGRAIIQKQRRGGLTQDESVAFLKINVNTQQLQGPLTSGQLSLFFDGMRNPYGRVGSWVARILLGLVVGLLCGPPAAASGIAAGVTGLSLIIAMMCGLFALTLMYKPCVRPMDNLMILVACGTVGLGTLFALIYRVVPSSEALVIVAGVIFMIGCICLAIEAVFSAIAITFAQWCPLVAAGTSVQHRKQWSQLGYGDVKIGALPQEVEVQIAGGENDTEQMNADRRQTLIQPIGFSRKPLHRGSDDDTDWVIYCKGVARCPVAEMEIEPIIAWNAQEPRYDTHREPHGGEPGDLPTVQVHINDLKNALIDAVEVDASIPAGPGALGDHRASKMVPNLCRPLVSVFAPVAYDDGEIQTGEWRHINLFSSNDISGQALLNFLQEDRSTEQYAMRTQQAIDLECRRYASASSVLSVYVLPLQQQTHEFALQMADDAIADIENQGGDPSFLLAQAQQQQAARARRQQGEPPAPAPQAQRFFQNWKKGKSQIVAPSESLGVSGGSAPAAMEDRRGSEPLLQASGALQASGVQPVPMLGANQSMQASRVTAGGGLAASQGIPPPALTASAAGVPPPLGASSVAPPLGASAVVPDPLAASAAGTAAVPPPASLGVSQVSQGAGLQGSQMEEP